MQTLTSLLIIQIDKISYPKIHWLPFLGEDNCKREKLQLTILGGSCVNYQLYSQDENTSRIMDEGNMPSLPNVSELERQFREKFYELQSNAVNNTTGYID